jgi:hypothetical protein
MGIIADRDVETRPAIPGDRRNVSAVVSAPSATLLDIFPTGKIVFSTVPGVSTTAPAIFRTLPAISTTLETVFSTPKVNFQSREKGERNRLNR